MSSPYFNPFIDLQFTPTTCFLTGENLKDNVEYISVFPEWLMKRFSLREKKFKMMDSFTSVSYSDLKLPCSIKVKQAFDTLETEIEFAFENGINSLKNLNENRLLVWMSKIIYGILYHDISFELEKAKRRQDTFKISTTLQNRFSILQLYLQSIIYPVTFKNNLPCSICIVNTKYSEDVFNYKDDTVNLVFFLGMKNFGIVACLMDNGIVNNEQMEIVKKIDTAVLHPIQFEELCARYIYTNYLLQSQFKYQINIVNNKVEVEFIPTEQKQALAMLWDDEMFSQVLSQYWQPWGIQKKDIIKFPNAPISFLIDEVSNEFILPESINFPF
ncbi:MAG: hypothetical protein LC096_04190 [Bacteroidia bacterium]|nr:hypothetical protein [Bacteroidia bacterium]